MRGSAQIFQKFEGPLKFFKFCTESENSRVRSNFQNFALLCEGPLKFFKFFKYCTKSKNNDFRHLEKISNPISTVGILGKFFENSCQQGLGRSQNCDSVAIYGLRPCSRSFWVGIFAYSNTKHLIELFSTVGHQAKKKNTAAYAAMLETNQRSLRWVSTDRNVEIALPFTTLGSLKVVYSWFKTATQHHILTQLTANPIEPPKTLCFGIDLSLPAPCTASPK